MLPELKAKKGRRPLKAPLSWVEKIELSSESWANERGVGWESVQFRPGGGRVSADMRVGWCRSICRSSVGRHIDRVSTDISAESIDRYSIDRCLKYTWSFFLYSGLNSYHQSSALKNNYFTLCKCIIWKKAKKSSAPVLWKIWRNMWGLSGRDGWENI